MIHTRLEGLIGDAERIARVAVAAYDLASLPSTAPSGMASYDNGDGTRTVIGPQAGGRTIATHVGDLTPPGRPLGVAGASSAGVVYIAWGGELDGGVPDDFDHVSLYMSVEGASELVGTLTEAGIVSTVPMATTASVEVWATAEDDACLADGTPAHNVSAESDRASVTVVQAADPAAVTDLLGTVTTLSRTRMLMATCDTGAATAAKAATLASGSLELRAGASVTVVFAHANTASAPTLDVGGTGARPLRTNGSASAYWVDGQAVVLTYDGTYWQVCSTPVYASTVTVGNPGGSNVRIDSNSVDVRDGTDVTASFQRDGVTFLGGKYAVKTYSTALAGSSDPVTGFQVSSPGPAKVTGATSSLVGDIGGVQSAVTAGWVQDIGSGAVMEARDKSSGAYHFVSVTPSRGIEAYGDMTVSGTIGLADKESALATRRGLRISQGSKVCHGHGTPWVTLFESWSDFKAATGCYDSGTPTLVTMNGDWGAFDGTLSGCEVQGGNAVYVLAQTTSGLPNISSTQSLRINWICIW